MSFGDRLKALRIERGWSQQQLASAAGLSQQAVDTYELDTREPGWSAVQKLAAALGVTCEAFACPPGELDSVESPPPPRPRGRPKKAPAAEPPKGKKE